MAGLTRDQYRHLYQFAHARVGQLLRTNLFEGSRMAGIANLLHAKGWPTSMSNETDEVVMEEHARAEDLYRELDARYFALLSGWETGDLEDAREERERATSWLELLTRELDDRGYLPAAEGTGQRWIRQ